ncbi:winged helix-turn-helix transcriptional regulator [Candidatus Woesearchaeota archaeon]|nr:winged helix-turn-helix transcriptional regulator [Candidatus Woesearchaeota archaeon]
MKVPLKHPYRLFFGTLANQYRLDIIKALKDSPKSVSQICRDTGCSQPTVSHNLRRLEHCGFVFVQPNGRQRLYSLNQETIKPLLDAMYRHTEKYCKKICKVR